jgi:AraC-like DNA-binding protein
MSLAVAVSRPCYSLRLVRPFLRVLNQHPGFPRELIAPLEQLDDDERIPIETLHELLRGAIVITNDEDLGLKAARELEVGSLGALEYAAASARTSRDALDVIARYMHLVNDALTFTFEQQNNGLTMVRLESSLALPRAAEDFEVAAFYIASRHRFTDEALPFHVYLQNAGSDSPEYARTFLQGVITFNAPFTGFSFETSQLDRELPAQDPKFHVLISRHADQLLASLPKVETFTERVRAQLVAELRGGDPTAPAIARRLGVSTRTLTRRLEDEGRSFKDLLEELRHGLAIRYTTSTDLLLSEVALLLGFSSAAAFNRAFKRWTGQSPIEYRRLHRKSG